MVNEPHPVDVARRCGAPKLGGNALKVNRNESAVVSGEPERSLLAPEYVFTALLQLVPQQAKVLELGYFGGLTEAEIAPL
ncbi:MAG: ECF-type sigma factor [Bryobacteraceae bacterium]|jgi:ECF sigma factor